MPSCKVKAWNWVNRKDQSTVLVNKVGSKFKQGQKRSTSKDDGQSLKYKIF